VFQIFITVSQVPSDDHSASADMQYADGVSPHSVRIHGSEGAVHVLIVVLYRNYYYFLI